MRLALLLLLLLLWICPLLANDGYTSAAGEGGRLRLLDREHPSIRMVKESVRIDVHLDNLAVTAQFQFHNDGPATTVTMGFPESGQGGGDGGGNYREYRQRSGFTNFTSTVDGKPVAVERMVKVAEDARYRALWVKRVAFAAGQTRTVCVSYRAKPGRAGAVGEGDWHVLRYDFTGGNWKGEVERADLVITSHIPGAMLLAPKLPDRKRITAKAAKGNRLTITWQHWQAQGDFTCKYTATYPEWLALQTTPPHQYAQWDFFCPVKPAFTLLNPGTPAQLLWGPAATRRHGIVYVKLDALARYLDGLARSRKQSLDVKVSSDDGTVLQVGDRRFRFRLREAAMQVDGTTVALPNRTFLSVPEPYYGNRLYVPLAPVITALGGTVQVDEKTRLVRPVLPK